MLVQKLNEKIDSWLEENVSEETKKLKLEAEREEAVKSVYDMITKELVKSLKPVKNSTLFEGQYSMQIKLPEGEKSVIDSDYLVREGIRLAWITSIYSLPLLMKKLEKDKEEIEKDNQSKMDFLLIDTDGKKEGGLLISIKMKNRKVNFEEKKLEIEEKTPVEEETPVLSKKKKSFWDKILRR